MSNQGNHRAATDVQHRSTSVDTFRARAGVGVVHALVQTVAYEPIEWMAGTNGNGGGQDRPRRHAPRGNAGLHKVWRSTKGANRGTAVWCRARPIQASLRAVYTSVRWSATECDPCLIATRTLFDSGRSCRERAAAARESASCRSGSRRYVGYRRNRSTGRLDVAKRRLAITCVLTCAGRPR